MDTKDIEKIRWIIWREVLRLIERIEERHNVSLRAGAEICSASYQGLAIPEVETWKMVETLSFAVILSSAEKISAGTIITDIFRKLGPIEFKEHEEFRFLWAQPSLRGRSSGLGGRPDLVVTSSSSSPSFENILRIIECKAGKELGTTIIRREFGKAFDLDVSSYLIWSLMTPKARIIQGAKRLGLDVYSFEFDTERVNAFAQEPGLLEEFVRGKIEESWRGQRFLRTMDDFSSGHGKKWLDQ